MTRRAGWLIRLICESVDRGDLVEPFGAKELRAIGVRDSTAGGFTPKHAVGNPQGETELFVRVSPGRYRLNPDSRTVACLRRSPVGD